MLQRGLLLSFFLAGSPYISWLKAMLSDGKTGESLSWLFTEAWTVNRKGFYPNLAAEGLRSPMLTLPEAVGPKGSSDLNGYRCA